MTHTEGTAPPQAHPAHATVVVVADAGRARIFTAPPGNSRYLTEVDDLQNPGSHLQDHDYLSDRQGHASHGSSGHSYEPRQSHAEHSAEVFAKHLCDSLSAARYAHNVEHIYLIAPPAFLGLLRKNLDTATQRRVVLEVAADLSRHSVTDIRDALPAVL